MKKKTIEAIRKYCARRGTETKNGFFAEKITREWAATDGYSGIIFYGMSDADAENAVPYGMKLRINPINLHDPEMKYEDRNEYPDGTGSYCFKLKYLENVMKDIRRRAGTRYTDIYDREVRVGNYVFDMELCLDLARCMDSTEIIIHFPRDNRALAFMFDNDNRYVAFFMPIYRNSIDGVPELINWNFAKEDE